MWGATPVPTMPAVAAAAGFLLTAFNMVGTPPGPTGANRTVTVPDVAGVTRTVTVHVLPGARLLQVSPVMVNAAAPVSLTVSRPVADRPELVRVNACEADCRTVTCP